MVGKEHANEISQLIKTIANLLQNKMAKAALLSFAKKTKPGPLLKALELFDLCENLQQEKVKPIEQDDLDLLGNMGVSINLRSELKKSAGDRPKCNEIIKGIQISCANNMTLLDEFQEFETYIYTKAGYERMYD